MRKLQTTFLDHTQPVTEERYDEMLGVLPPERMAYGGFLVGEPVDHNEQGQPRYDMYFMETNTTDTPDDVRTTYYYAGLATTKDFDLWLIKE